jgi:glutamine synthetase
VLFAGLHGLRDELELEAPVAGDAYTQDAGAALPESLEASLAALESDAILRDALGPEIVDTFLAIKRFELDRHRQWVSDWELDEYVHHL